MQILLQKISRRPLVSIVTIVLNGEKVIRQTLDSVLQQTYSQVEYIVIDGGSSDGTVAILQEYDSQLAFWQSEADKGISDAFNKGIRLVHGEIVGLLNAGDWYEPDTVQNVVDTFLKYGDVGVVCGKLQFWKGRQREYTCSSVPGLLEYEMSVTHPSCFVRAELYDQLGLFSTDYTLAMDYELLLRLKINGADFFSLDRILTNMQHDGISEKNWRAALRETHKARTELLESTFFTSIWYYYFLCFKRWLRIVIERFGWEGLLRFYRSRIALVRKTK